MSTIDPRKEAKAQLKAAKAYAKAQRPWYKKKRFWILGVPVAIIAFSMMLYATSPTAQTARTEAAAQEAAKTATFRAKGEVVLQPGQFVMYTDNIHCTGKGGYDDITMGAQIKVTDASGKVIALSLLTESSLVDRIDSVKGKESCSFPFETSDIPVADGPIYGIQVAARRGVHNFVQSQADNIQLGLG